MSLQWMLLYTGGHPKSVLKAKKRRNFTTMLPAGHLPVAGTLKSTHMKPIPASELVINADGSIYHLNLHPEQIAPTVLLVGDPGRVPRVSRHFDHIEHQVQRREFVTHTGTLAGKRLSVVSTGIGTDNIDIVLNELDALANIDFETRCVKEQLSALRFIRLGTSGGLAADVPVGSVVVSAYGIGLDNLAAYYHREVSQEEQNMVRAFEDFARSNGVSLRAYAARGSEMLLGVFSQHRAGITLTCPGFYGPQGRNLRLQSIYNQRFFDEVGNFHHGGFGITNFEMETSAIFALARMLGHQALSCNAILANRLRKEFARDPASAVNNMIEKVLETIADSGRF